MKVTRFSKSALAKTLANKHTLPTVISSKSHFKYLYDYLSHEDINAKTIVEEFDYISRDYLHDYTSYYAFCFESYSKTCKRLHFFDSSFTLPELKQKILNNDQKFWSHYLGFIVIKPLPYTVIGYTLLKTYKSGDKFGARCFWGLRDYKVHVFGTEVEIKSLAFQEQDTILAACATTAIWSMLNKAAAGFHMLKSPSQITKDADNLSNDGSRLFPNKGLDTLQICQAIENSGLVCDVKNPIYEHVDVVKEEFDCVSNDYLKKIVNAYSSIGIPLILIVNVPFQNDVGKNEYDLHAIVISGHKMSKPQLILPNNSTSWMASNIEKLYSHDDQYGPFVRIDLVGECELKALWTDFDPSKRSMYVSNIVIPLYPKIRIAYDDVEPIVLGLDAVLTLFFDKKIVADLVWDVKVVLSENYKSKIRDDKSLNDAQKLKTLTHSMPKYIWICSCFIGSYNLIDFMFDATGINHAMLGVDIISYLPLSIHKKLVAFIKSDKNLISDFVDQNYYSEFLSKYLK